MQILYISELYTIRTNIFNIIICHQHGIHKNSEACPAYIKHEKNNEYLLITFYWKSAQQAVINKWNWYVKMCRKIHIYQHVSTRRRNEKTRYNCQKCSYIKRVMCSLHKINCNVTPKTVVENVNILIPSFMQNNLNRPVQRLSYMWTVQNTGMHRSISVRSYGRVQYSYK
jgi:hypothetical protein